MEKHTILRCATHNAAHSAKHVSEHLTEILAKTTKMVLVGEGSIISIRNMTGLSRHALPIMISSEDRRNTYHKNLFLLDTFGLKAHEADFMYIATVLSAIWEDPTNNETFAAVNRLAASLYNQWLAGTYIRQFGITMDEADSIRVIVGIYYYLQGQTFNEDKFRSDDLLGLIRRVADNTGIPDKRVRELVDSLELLTHKRTMDYNWLMSKLTQGSEILHHRLNNVTALTSVSNSWYRGMVHPPQLAMNYKPFFIAMLYTAFKDRSASRTGIDTLIKATLEGRRRDQAETFVKAIDGIINSQVTR